MEADGAASSGDKLLTAARDGAPQALGQLLEEYRNFFTVLVRIQIGRRLQSKADAVDVVQDTFLDAHRTFHQFRGTTREEFTGWLKQILIGKLASLVRRFCQAQSRDVNLEQAIGFELDSSSDQVWKSLKADGSTPSESAARREETVRLADALEQLPDDYREVILLRQIEGLPFTDVAQRLGRSEDSVQKLWVRGLDALRRILEPAR